MWVVCRVSCSERPGGEHQVFLRFRAYTEAANECEIARGTERSVPLDYTPRAQFRLSPYTTKTR